MKKCHQNRGVPQNAYSLKLKSTKRIILYEIYSTKEPILGFFSLFNYQIDSALTFSSGLETEVSHVVQVRAVGPKAPSPGQRPQAAHLEGAEALSPGHRPQAARPEGAEALSPGHRPGYDGNQQGAL